MIPIAYELAITSTHTHKPNAYFFCFVYILLNTYHMKSFFILLQHLNLVACTRKNSSVGPLEAQASGAGEVVIFCAIVGRVEVRQNR